MEKAEVKRIAHYIEELENSLGHWDCQGTATYRHLIKLHLTIERLAETSCNAKDQRTLTVLENKARRCKQCIETRLALHS